ncbi:hypothetical protein HYPSUDRAFT_893095 [Hypholoma sublateritium FD-334 SS-4]|uniref:Uncharacterized protein n=1 Tax=Hypholoma sublateritium (strain FD-334 SS-4) TaxID=945553 RepID=A0A0D2NS84_HYPSF|nr:hypothetical protein HYPSUDRAFT_893095 [Hypholoma sublateritium FD-334 SS-4]
MRKRRPVLNSLSVDLTRLLRRGLRSFLVNGEAQASESERPHRPGHGLLFGNNLHADLDYIREECFSQKTHLNFGDLEWHRSAQSPMAWYLWTTRGAPHFPGEKESLPLETITMVRPRRCNF